MLTTPGVTALTMEATDTCEATGNPPADVTGVGATSASRMAAARGAKRIPDCLTILVLTEAQGWFGDAKSQRGSVRLFISRSFPSLEQGTAIRAGSARPGHFCFV